MATSLRLEVGGYAAPMRELRAGYTIAVAWLERPG